MEESRGLGAMLYRRLNFNVMMPILFAVFLEQDSGEAAMRHARLG